jgi:DnaJ-class molecular chaperone
METRKKCELCDGSGEIPRTHCNHSGHVQCPKCSGTGEVPEWGTLRYKCSCAVSRRHMVDCSAYMRI